jgi:ribosomal protein L37AE/L43A
MNYTPFEDLRPFFGLEPIRKHTNNKKRLESIQKRFTSRHVCPICKQEMKHVEGTNVMVCNNPSCKGQKIKVYDENRDGENLTINCALFHTLDETGAKIANNIFYE